MGRLPPITNYILKKLLSVFFENHTGVMTAKAERVAQCSTHFTLLCLIEGEVQVVVDFLVFVVFLVVDGRRNNVVLHGQH